MRKKLLSWILIIGISISLLPTTALAGYFKDVDEDHPYFEAIDYLYQHGIIQGYSDQTFRPDRKVNRAEALKILLLGSSIQVAETVTDGGFKDIIATEWYARYIVKAKQIGIVSGNPDGTFAPERTLNLAESMKMIIRTNGFVAGDYPDGNPFADVDRNQWHAPYFEYGKNNNLFTISGDKKIFPSQEMTRGYLAFLMYKAIIHKKEAAQEKKLASYYSDKFNGRTTASGEIFDNSKLTAAHLTLPFGTKVRVMNVRTGASVIVTINDRGPYSDNRIIDLSTAAFEKISPLSAGLAPVAIEVIDDSKTPTVPLPTVCNVTNNREEISNEFYANVVLDAPLPTVFLKNEVYTIRGSSLSDKAELTASLFFEDNQADTVSVNVEADGSFELPLLFKKVGTYNLALLPGKSGSSKVFQIQIIPEECEHAAYPSEASAPQDVSIKVRNNETYISWKQGTAPLTKVRITDGSKEESFVINNSAKEFKVPYELFEGFSAGEAYLEVASAQSSSRFSLDRSSTWNFATRVPFYMTRHQFGETKDEYLTVTSFSYNHFQSNNINLEALTKLPLLDQAFVIQPNGKINNLTLQSDLEKQIDIHEQSIIPEGANISLSFPADQKGTYVVSLYNTEGKVIFNYPSYNANEKPILPDILDLTERTPYNDDMSIIKMRQDLFALINQERQLHGLPLVEIYDNLNELAQVRSDDMSNRDYFSHYNLEGEDVNATRLLYNIKTPLKENIAKDTSIEFVHYMLMRSAKHRKAIIDPSVTRVGIGVAKHIDGTLIVTELFSAEPISADDTPALRDQIFSSLNKRRSDADLTPYTLNTFLNPIAEQWSNRMSNEDFCSGTSPGGETINDDIENSAAQINGGLTRFLCNTDYDNAVQSILDHESALSTEFDTVGLGISQDDTGIIRFTIIFADQN